MQELSPETFRLIYGLTYFVLGLAVGVRALGHQSSSLRNRLFALAAFGLLHAGAVWLLITSPVESTIVIQLQTVLYAASFLALYYFALGWNEKWPMTAHLVSLVTIFGLVIAFLAIADEALNQKIVRFGIGLPATICAALVFLCDSTFRFGSRSSETAKWVVGTTLFVYAALFFAADPSNLLPTSTFNIVSFEAVIGVTPDFIRGAAIIVVTLGLLTLLGHFDAAIRLKWQERVADVESALTKAKASLKRSLEFGKLGSWEWDIATGEVDWSDQAYRIYGLNPRETKASYASFLESVHPEDRATVEQEMHRVLQYCAPYKSEHRIIRPNGSVRSVQAHGKVEVGPDGTARKLLGVTCDITELVATKKEMDQARVAAEASSEAKSNFMANMSHELRTPLNAILGFSEIMESELYGTHSNPLYQNYAGDIRKSGQHLLSVINDILTVSRFEAGKTELNEEAAIVVEELINKCTKWVERKAEEGGVKVRTSVAAGLPALRGDPRLLVQAFLNLISNAVKFTPREGLVEISVNENSLGGINISVQDTGIGMSADQIKRIGEPFLQFDDTRIRKFEGTGLGLVIAKQLLELHGCKLEIESTPNVGTIFSANLPPGRSVRHRSRQLRAWGTARAS